MNKKEIITKLIGNTPNHFIKPRNGYITVAELNTIQEKGEAVTIDLNTALVNEVLLSRIKPSHTNPFVYSTGVNYDENFKYSPSFWLFLTKTIGLKKVEPLVISWQTGNLTTLQIDQGFLGTFDLVPRLLEKEILWDDLKAPQFAVVKNKLLSEYNFPTHTEVYVKVKSEYFNKYLYLRKKKAVHIFTIKKNITINDDIENILNGKEIFNEEYGQYHIRIRKYPHKEDQASLEINGFQILDTDSDPKENKEIIEGHYWKGTDGLVTEWRARYEMPFEHVYVSDKVLERFESDHHYDVCPQSGSVSYRNQWNVSHCDRVGKNAIRLEIKKLYEGNRPDTISYWNQFSIYPNEVIEGEHIAEKAKRLTQRFLLFSRLLSSLVQQQLNIEVSPQNLISIDEEYIDYTGWTDFPDFKPITHIVDLDYFSKDQFLARCKKLYALLGENLKEKELRKIIITIGFPEKVTKGYKSLKLLELILKYFHVINSTGLNHSTSKDILVEETLKLKEYLLLSPLFALNNIRQLDAHKSGNHNAKLEKALITLSLKPNSISNNYADACFQVYDSLTKMYIELSSSLYNVS